MTTELAEFLALERVRQLEKAAARALSKAIHNFSKPWKSERLREGHGPRHKSPKEELMALSGTLRKPAPGRIAERGICYKLVKRERLQMRAEERKRNRVIAEAGL